MPIPGAKRPDSYLVKTSHTTKGTVQVDQSAGVVSAIVNLYGIVDSDQDIIKAGAFAESVKRDFSRFQVLDSHNFYSAQNIVATPIELREIGRSELPRAVLDEHPDATGGLFIKAQFMLDDPASAAIFRRIKAKAAREWSIGFDVLESGYSKGPDGRTVRVITKARIWEASVVIFGANQGTSTIEARSHARGRGGKKKHEFLMLEARAKRSLLELETIEDRPRPGSPQECTLRLAEIMADLKMAETAERKQALELQARALRNLFALAALEEIQKLEKLR